MIALLDYGSGNLRSVHKALLAVGAGVEVIDHASRFRGGYRGMVLPGVGTFDDCVRALRTRGLRDCVLGHVEEGRKFLGICVGYQVLFECSREFESREQGLGIWKGSIVRFEEGQGIKVPQIGWNTLDLRRSGCPLYRGVPQGSHAYFVHSYYPEPREDDLVATRTPYPAPFASSAWRDNVCGTQFHPEKSQSVGLSILRNFVEWAV